MLADAWILERRYSLSHNLRHNLRTGLSQQPYGHRRLNIQPLALQSIHNMWCQRHVTMRMRSLNRKTRVLPGTLVPWHRGFHQAKAKFTTVDSKGKPTSYATEIRVGDAHEAYVYIEPAVGDAIKSAIAQLSGDVGLTRGAVEQLPLRFHHGSYHFAHGMEATPRHATIPLILCAVRCINADNFPTQKRSHYHGSISIGICLGRLASTTT